MRVNFSCSFRCLFVLSVISLRAAAATQAQDLRSIHYGTTASVSHLPIWVAKDAGFFARNGLNVEPVHIRGGALITMGIMSGQLQFSGAGAESIVAARIEGGDVVLLACPVDSDPVYLITRPEIKSAEELKGKATAVTRLGDGAGADPGDTDALGQTRRLDRLAAGFVEAQRGIDVLKVDTDGFDAKVLRSARTLLADHHPCLFFELHPALWDEAGEDPRAAFAFLAELGYNHFVFFTNRGTVHLQCHGPDPLLLDSLIALSRARRALDDFHFDVLTGDPAVCQAVAAASLARVAAAGKDRGHPASGRGAGSPR